MPASLESSANFSKVGSALYSNKNWHLQKPAEWVIVYRKSEGVEPDELQTFLQGTAEIVSNLEAGTAKGATL